MILKKAAPNGAAFFYSSTRSKDSALKFITYPEEGISEQLISGKPGLKVIDP